MCAAGAVVGDGAVYVGTLVTVMVYNYDRHLAAQQRQQRFTA